MKKRAFLLFITALLLLSPALTATAQADSFCDLGSVYSGSAVSYRIADISEGCTASCNNFPIGLQLTAVDGGIYISGSPQYAGEYSFVVYTDDPVTGSVSCNLSVMTAPPVMTPTQVMTSADVDCSVGDYALLSVSAAGGAAGYQWYAGASPEGLGGYAVSGANGPEYSPPTSVEGTVCYYCVVTDAQGTAVPSRAIRVTVRAKEAQSISVHTLPHTVEYRMGQLTGLEGLTLEVRYADGSSDLVSEGFTVFPGNYNAFANTLVLNIEYQGRRCSIPVNVTDSEPEIASIGMIKLPDKQEYSPGERFDGTGLVFRVYYTDGTCSDESDGYTAEPVTVSGSGTQTVTLFYRNCSCTFPITVRTQTVPADQLEIASTPAKLGYTVGESLDTSGLVLRETVNGISASVHTGYTVSPKVLTTVGVQTVTVSYNGRNAYFTVDVKEAAAKEKTDLTGVKKKIDSAMDKINIKPAGTANKGTIVVILVIALLLLGGLGVYMVILEKGGIEEIRYKLEVFAYNLRGRFGKK